MSSTTWLSPLIWRSREDFSCKSTHHLATRLFYILSEEKHSHLLPALPQVLSHSNLSNNARKHFESVWKQKWEQVWKQKWQWHRKHVESKFSKTIFKNVFLCSESKHFNNRKQSKNEHILYFHFQKWEFKNPLLFPLPNKPQWKRKSA